MERLFSYGTLQFEKVQIETFGRKLNGCQDELIGYEVSEVRIKDKEVIRKSGTDIHPILKHTGNASDKVAGMVFEITSQELARADEYEVDAYKRAKGELSSGSSAWIYAEALK